jgi:hypothetical protein
MSTEADQEPDGPRGSDEDTDVRRLRNAAAQLMEHFDTVQIFATRHVDSETGTRSPLRNSTTEQGHGVDRRTVSLTRPNPRRTKHPEGPDDSTPTPSPFSEIRRQEGSQMKRPKASFGVQRSSFRLRPAHLRCANARVILWLGLMVTVPAPYL